MVTLREPPLAPAPSTFMIGLILALQTLTLIAVLVGFYFFGVRNHQATAHLNGSAQHIRELASKLKAAGATHEAAALYATYLERSDLPIKTHARIAYSLGQLYLENGQYSQALRWFYESESTGQKKVIKQAGQKIVHCLERLGRVHAAQAALAARSSLDANAIAHASDDPVVAEVGSEKFYGSDVMRSLDDLPKEYRQQFKGPNALAQYLQKYIADELMWRKAQKLEYDKDPKVRQQLETLLKQVVVGRFMEQEILQKVTLDEGDLKNYFEAHKNNYGGQDFSKARTKVEHDYRMEKIQHAAGRVIQDEFELQAVKLYPERLKR